MRIQFPGSGYLWEQRMQNGDWGFGLYLKWIWQNICWISSQHMEGYIHIQHYGRIYRFVSFFFPCPLVFIWRFLLKFKKVKNAVMTGFPEEWISSKFSLNLWFAPLSWWWWGKWLNPSDLVSHVIIENFTFRIHPLVSSASFSRLLRNVGYQ